jgi:ABC-2 type transport system ATP-binding protein
VISVKGLTKSYHTPVLDGVTFDFESRAVTFVVGPNGAGKTTLFKCILGLEGFGGEVLFDGRPLSEVREHVVSVFDDAPFYPHLSGSRNLRLLLGERFDTDAAARAMAMGGNEAHRLLERPVGRYSNGQRKRLAVCHAVLAHPRYLLMDEVAGGLDLESMDAVSDMVRTAASSATVVVSGHQFEFYSRILDRVAALDHGRLEPVEIHDRSAHALESTYRRLLAPRPN